MISPERPGALERRLATRPAHLHYLEGHATRLVQAGPLLDAASQPVGSLFLLEAEDRAQAEAFAAADPYVAADVFESTVIHPFRSVYKDGARLA